MNGIAEVVLRGGQGVTTSQMMEFSRKIPLLRLKVETMRDSGVPHLHDQTMFLARYAEDVLDGVYQSNDISAIMETVFALEYFFKGVDIIPDDVPEIGFKDDSAIVRTVLTGHEQEFRDFAKANSLDFERLTLEA